MLGTDASVLAGVIAAGRFFRAERCARLITSSFWSRKPRSRRFRYPGQSTFALMHAQQDVVSTDNARKQHLVCLDTPFKQISEQDLERLFQKGLPALEGKTGDIGLGK
ncbi:hypothetical protein N7490_006940 [Penicillium lividum]|nr:hypothetical protein N7490_006940 [Penicillium lividum]